jgi:hypothetical protein
MLSVGYVGTRGEHLIGDPYRNADYVPTAKRLQLRNNIYNSVPVDPSIASIYGCPADACPGTIGYLPYPQYTNISDMISNDGWNLYNSLQVKFEKRTSKGLNIIAAYTFQKNLASANLSALANAEITPGSLQGNLGRELAIPATTSFSGSTIEDPDNRRRYKSLSPDDTHQILNLAVVYELPFGYDKHFLNQSKGLDKLVGGWKLSQNWNFQSGVPLVFTSGACNGISCKPNLIGNLSSRRGGKSRVQLENQWLNPKALEAPFGSDPTVIKEVTSGNNPDGTPLDFNTLDQWWVFGNIASNVESARSPGYWNADLSLAKNFYLSESRHFELRWELLNAFNHQNLGIPKTAWCLPPNADGSTDAIHQFGCQFGKITNVQTDPRAMEFALKFYW